MSERGVIAIVDANNFYASCERIFNPALEGKPVVVLSNNDGCVIARSAEAKDLNVDMTAPWHKIAQAAMAQGVIAVSSNYELYGDISARVVEILAEFSIEQEVYSIDESFIRLPGTVEQATATARQIRRTIGKHLGLPVSIGIAPTKTLAKLANRGSKVNASLAGVCHFGAYTPAQVTSILGSVDVGDVWGVGGRTAKKLAALGIITAADYRDTDARAIRKKYGIVQERVVQELRGVDCIPMAEEQADREQIQFSRSFATPISTRTELDEVLSVYAQRAAARLRAQGSLARAMRAFCSTSAFSAGHASHAVSVAFPDPTDDPQVILRAAKTALGPQLEPGQRYVRAGIVLSEFSDRNTHATLDLFGLEPASDERGALLDSIAARFGREAVGFGFAGIREDRTWTMRREMVSPRATTHWDELATVKAN